MHLQDCGDQLSPSSLPGTLAAICMFPAMRSPSAERSPKMVEAARASRDFRSDPVWQAGEGAVSSSNASRCKTCSLRLLSSRAERPCIEPSGAVTLIAKTASNRAVSRKVLALPMSRSRSRSAIPTRVVHHTHGSDFSIQSSDQTIKVMISLMRAESTEDQSRISRRNQSEFNFTLLIIHRTVTFRQNH